MVRLIECVPYRFGSSPILETHLSKLRLPDGLPLGDGDKITIGLRSEHIKLGDKDGLGVEVEVIEPLGLSAQFYVKLGNQQICVLAMGRPTVGPGETVRLSAEPSALHVFDPQSGRRLVS